MVELICSHFTLGAEASFDERVAAASAAGFDAIGMLFATYQAERDRGRSPAELRRVADDHGVRVAEIEFVYGWTGGPVTDAPMVPAVSSEEIEAVVHEMADAFGSRHVNVGDIGMSGPMLPVAEVAERFAGICDRAA